jgi:SAM-dependent methyltransferase
MRQDLFICPRCRTALERTTPDRFTCPRDGLEFRSVDGIWRFLLPESEAHYASLLRAQEPQRLQGESESRSVEYYRALPFKDLTGHHAADWRIRARSFSVLVNNVLTPLQNPLERSLKILDLGAGNGWLANRLAGQGDRVIAVDLQINDREGLGAWKFYEHQFTPVQADFHHLPVMDRFADAVIFSASFHHSDNDTGALREALRVLSPKGRIVIMGSPVYRSPASGQRMLQEQTAELEKKHGSVQGDLQREGFLTYSGLADLGRELKLSWKFLKPFYGVGWMLRPLISTVSRRGEPAKYPVLVGRKIPS